MYKFLLIDVGNGRTKLALASREAILERRELPTSYVGGKILEGDLDGWGSARVVA